MRDVPTLAIEHHSEMSYWTWLEGGIKMLVPFCSSPDESVEECLSRGTEFVRALLAHLENEREVRDELDFDDVYVDLDADLPPRNADRWRTVDAEVSAWLVE